MNDELNQPTPPQDMSPKPQTSSTTPQELSSVQHNPSKKILVAAVALLVIIGGGALYFVQKDGGVRSSQNEQNTFQQASSSKDAEQEKPTVQKEAVTYKSTLWPDFSFTVPDGWEVEEPSEYDTTSFGEGWADGIITATKDDATVRFEMKTVAATGFEGYSCRLVDGLQKVGEYYRYVDEEGTTVYADGVGQDDEEWESAINGEFSNLESENPNYCVLFPYIGTYSSTINQADFDQPYGFNNNEKAMVWLAVYVDGDPNETLLAEIDEMVISKSASAEIL